MGGFLVPCLGILQWESMDLVDKEGLRVNRVDKDGYKIEGIYDENPMIKTAERATKLYLAFCQRFGLTPADRTRINLPEKKEKDEFAEFD